MPHIWEIEDILLKKLSYWRDLDNTTKNTVYQDILARWARSGRNWTNLDNFIRNYIDAVIHGFYSHSSSEEGIWEVYAEWCKDMNLGIR